MSGPTPFDEVGYWSEVKLSIIRKYAKAYSKILTNQKKPRFEHLYIDAFAGSGMHTSKTTGENIDGSPTIALQVHPPFREYHFIDLNPQKVDSLLQLAKGRNDVFVYHGDCNEVLLNQIVQRVQYEDFRRALCVLDPYGLDLRWEVVRELGKMRTFDVFLNFPVTDMNRNVLWKCRQGVSESQVGRMNFFWGDDSWKKIAFTSERDLFGEVEVKAPTEIVAEAYRTRLKKIAGFKNVPKPIAMKNSSNSIVYYLFFASHNSVADSIVGDVFDKARTLGAG